MKPKHIKLALDERAEELAIHIAADPQTLRELQTHLLIDCQKKGIPYVHQDHE